MSMHVDIATAPPPALLADVTAALRERALPLHVAVAWNAHGPAAWAACDDGRDLAELLDALDPHRAALAGAACARTVLHLVPAGENRPRVAIETAERWARGAATDAELDAAQNAARAAASAAARAAARDAHLAVCADAIRAAVPCPTTAELVEACRGEGPGDDSQ